jgi:tripartite-type tricarboxylate transporter receptor subunit TctC
MKNLKITLMYSILCFFSSLSWAKNVELVIPFSPGGAADIVAQTIVPQLKQELAASGINIVTIYKPGAGATIGNAYAASTDQPRLTLTSSAVVSSPIINRTNQYNLATDLRLVTFLGYQTSVLSVRSASAIKTIQDLEVACRQNKLNFGSGGAGTASHLVAEIVVLNLKCNATNITYRGGAPTTVDLLAGHIQFAAEFYSGHKQLIESGQLRPLLIFGKTRIPELSGVPNFTDLGFDTFGINNWFAVLANRALSDQDLQAVRTALSKVLANASVSTQLKNMHFTDTDAISDAKFLVNQERDFKKLLDRLKIND